MTPMRLINATTGLLVAERVRKVDDPFARMVGLLTKASVGSEEGIWLKHCSVVHTIGMRATIDLIFLDASDCVVGTTTAAVPNRPTFSARGAKAIVELGAGSRLWAVSIGDRLALVLP
jgi:uncharacterized membrane protein (UPF0127 family)